MTGCSEETGPASSTILALRSQNKHHFWSWVASDVSASFECSRSSIPLKLVWHFCGHIWMDDEPFPCCYRLWVQTTRQWWHYGICLQAVVCTIDHKCTSFNGLFFIKLFRQNSTSHSLYVLFKFYPHNNPESKEDLWRLSWGHICALF